jgi:predicted nucleic acid-binding protein
MMKIVCDADGLIKINKAGILALLDERVEIIVGPEVYREVVTIGKEHGHSDALEIEKVLPKPTAVVLKNRSKSGLKILPDELELGAGEKETLVLYERVSADVILSDDRKFLRELDSIDVPYITPAAMIVALAERKILHIDSALEALTKLSEFVRKDQFQAAQEELNAMRKEKG